MESADDGGSSGYAGWTPFSYSLRTGFGCSGDYSSGCRGEVWRYSSQNKMVEHGGGHHITRSDYDIARLERVIGHMQEKWKVEIYLEPGEAIALNAGYLVSRVLDVTKNGEICNVILDTSAACHMPDVIEMPYMPPLHGADENGSLPFEFRLGGPTCLAGDIIGDYSFEKELKTGDLLLFGDMAIYTTCKNNTFNGMSLPDIWKRSQNGKFSRLTEFGYSNFKIRLGK